MLGNVKVLCSVTPLATRLSHSSAAFTEIHYRMTYSDSVRVTEIFTNNKLLTFLMHLIQAQNFLLNILDINLPSFCLDNDIKIIDF